MTHPRREDGQALVELALVLPLLLIILFGIVDFGIALNQYNDTTNLANLGARAASVASTTWTPPTCPGEISPASLTSYLRCEGALDSVSLSNVNVCPSDTSGTTWAEGDTIQITVRGTFNWMQVLVGGVGHLGGSVPSPTSTISSTATMREEADNSASGEPLWVSAGSSC